MADAAEARAVPAQPQQQVVVVSPELLQQTVDLLQDELPMKKARAVVQALERCPIMGVTASQPGGMELDDSGPDSDSD